MDEPCITGLAQSDDKASALTFTPMDDLELPINLNAMSLDFEEARGHRQKPHVHRERPELD